MEERREGKKSVRKVRKLKRGRGRVLLGTSMRWAYWDAMARLLDISPKIKFMRNFDRVFIGCVVQHIEGPMPSSSILLLPLLEWVNSNIEIENAKRKREMV